MGGSESSAMALPSVELPFDILTIVFSHLGLDDLFKCQLVCKDWRQAAQHDSLMRPLCRARGYIGRTQDLSDLWKPARPLLNDQSRLSDGHRQPHFRLLDRPYGNDVSSWEDILKRAQILTKARFPPPCENVDFAPGPSALQGTIKCYSNRDEETQSDIWKVQIDHIGSVMITTASRGGLAVLDLDTGKELWRDSSMKAYANLEFGEGWVVHDRDNRDGQGHLEIRKFERLVAGQKHPRRGRLVSTGKITCSTTPSAFRLIWPYLAVAGLNNIAIYDITRCKLMEQFDLSRTPASTWPIRYINMDQDYIFVLAGDRIDMYASESEEVAERGGLFVYARGQKGKLIFNGWMGHFDCLASWYLVDEGLGEMEYQDQPIKDCPSLGIPNGMVRNTEEDRWRYEQTMWCEAVHPDHLTGSLVLSGRGRLMVIPYYKKALKRIGSITGDACLRSIGIGTDDPYCGRAATHLGVADGVAAFISAAHHTPVWVDLQSLILAARNQALTPRASMLCLGQTTLNSNTAIIFKTSSCLLLTRTRLVVVADFLLEHPARGGRGGGGGGGGELKYKAYSMAIAMDFGSIVQAQLECPGASLHRVPRQIAVSFPRRSISDQLERERWKKSRDGWSQATVIFPNGRQVKWSGWAPHLQAAESSEKKEKTEEKGEGGRKKREYFVPFAWAGRDPLDEVGLDDMLLDGMLGDDVAMQALLAQLALGGIH